MASYTFNLSKTNDLAAAVSAFFAGAISYLSGFSVKVSLLAAVVSAAGVVGYTGVVPASA